MSLILIQTIVVTVSSTLTWIGFYIGIRALPDARARKSRWIIGSAVVAAAWLFRWQSARRYSGVRSLTPKR